MKLPKIIFLTIFKKIKHAGKLEKLFLLILFVAVLQVLILAVTLLPLLKNTPNPFLDFTEKINLKNSLGSAKNVSSDFGYKLTYDENQFRTSGIVFKADATNYDEYTGVDALEGRSYAIYDFYPKDKLTKSYFSASINTSIRKNFFSERKKDYGDLSENDLTIKWFKPKDSTEFNYSYKLLNSELVKIGSEEYSKLTYKLTYNSKALSEFLSGELIDQYITVKNDRPYVINVSYKKTTDLYVTNFQKILESIVYFTPKEGSLLAAVDNPISSKLLVSKNLGTQVLGETTQKTNTSSSAISENTIKVVSRNQPAVAKIGSLVCGDVTMVTKAYNISVPIAKGLCGGGFGSGFFLSEDGYLGTNGHVVDFGGSELVATGIYLGDKEVIRNSYIWFVRSKYGDTPSESEINAVTNDIVNNESSAQKVATIFLSFPKEFFEISDKKQSYAVQLGNDPINLNFGGKNANSKFNYSDSVIKAELVSKDYNSDDLLNLFLDPKAGFTSSDVALLKVDGNNFPIVRTGSVENLVSGSEITVIGYPGNSDNELVSKETSKPTATRGVVSAVREASGNKKKLIQSDVSIDHGNSGGPAFDGDGRVVGLATYGIPGEVGKFNYMRDVQDLLDVVVKKNIDLNQDSATQNAWDVGLEKFSQSHFRSAVSNFKKVLSLYPNHQLAQSYIGIAQEKIKNGEDKLEPWFYYSEFALLVVTSAICIGIFVFSRKRKKASSNFTQQPPAPNYPIQAPRPPQLTKAENIALSPNPLVPPKPPQPSETKDSPSWPPKVYSE